MLWASLFFILGCGLANAGKARIRDSLASTICGSMKAYSSTKKVVGLLKIPNQFSEMENCKICRDVRLNDCKSNGCQKFNYVPCTNQEIPSDTSGKSLGKSTRIVSGRYLNPHELPFLVKIEKEDWQHCGGSIYNQNWIITAAHCVVPSSGKPANLTEYSIIAGSHNSSLVEPTAQKVHMKSIVAHKGFDRDLAWQFDIALVQVDPPFKLNSAVAPICLASQNDKVQVGQQVRVSGWGAREDKEPYTPYPDVPKTVTIKTISLEDCQNTYIKFGNLSQANICAIPDSSEQAGACQADSGGPLTLDKSGSRFLVGLVSGAGGYECGVAHTPTVYTSVASFHDWIVENAIIEEDNCKICRDVRMNDCKSNSCQEFNYVACTNQEIPSDTSGKSLGKSTRIVSGRYLNPHELPFLVKIEKEDWQHCGGSIYNQNWIITAAHCVVPSSGKPANLTEYSIIAGSHNSSLVEPTAQKVHMKSIVAHKGFDRDLAWQFDIAVVQVDPPFKFNSAVAPACLASPNDKVQVGQQVRVSGWGAREDKEPYTPYPDVPKTVTIKTISLEDCQNTYIKFGNLSQANICAIPESSEQAGACQADSGGPLTLDKSGSRFLVGLVSGAGGYECGVAHTPTVYTSVAHFHDWIVENAVIGNDTDDCL